MSSPRPPSLEPTPPPGRGRRSFLNWILGTSLGALGASVLYPVARFLSPPEVPEAATHQVEAGNTNDPELLEKGFRIVRFGAEPVILIRLSDNDFRAFTATCTHLDCIVGYRQDVKKIWCNCHDGQFDLQGRNIAGPPPRPLDPLRVELVSQGPGRPRTVVIRRS